ncbi:UNVERIFIED_CONTAM: hypothetical protein Sindi_2879900 [Sesamum indicum]
MGLVRFIGEALGDNPSEAMYSEDKLWPLHLYKWPEVELAPSHCGFPLFLDEPLDDQEVKRNEEEDGSSPGKGTPVARWIGS